MNWQPYPQTKPPKAGEYLAWEVFHGKGFAWLAQYTKREGFEKDEYVADKYVTHWAEIVPPQVTAPPTGAVHG
jgi:hypothetical protein